MQFQSVFSIFGLLVVAQASPSSKLKIGGRGAVSTANTAQCPDYCAGTLNNQTLIHDYVCGDTRLGPKRLPTKLVLGSELATYDRFGGLCPGDFLSKWYNATTNSYIYPIDNGFQLSTSSAPIEANITLPVGSLLDRFGSEYGSFMSPYGAPYMQRALPPSNLDTPASSPTWPYNYHVYNVTKSLDTLAGPIAPWFGQPGQGVQYNMYTNVLGLINGGYLSRVTLN
ncbi:hypothetical protein BDZ45DRAFT_651075 [Acephala macrosclerotiorum]|nr:hypothetical protein BDZ45DRAFT_651075 [Acephala macrosclerotiorum]